MTTRVTTAAAASGIAIIAAFDVVIASAISSDAEFKPIRADRQLDVSCYGWQKRQDVARNGNVVLPSFAGGWQPTPSISFPGREEGGAARRGAAR